MGVAAVIYRCVFIFFPLSMTSRCFLKLMYHVLPDPLIFRLLSSSAPGLQDLKAQHLLWILLIEKHYSLSSEHLLEQWRHQFPDVQLEGPMC